MKPGPVIAMILLIFLGMWLVLQPALSRSKSDFTMRIGSKEIMLERTTDANDQPAYTVISPASLRSDDPIPHDRLDEFLCHHCGWGVVV